MGDRPRIAKNEEKEIIDPLSYSANSSTDFAKKFHECSHDLSIELWLDKHCSLRQTERLGIDIDSLQKLALQAIKHIFYYQLRDVKFNIIQYPEFRGKDKRITIRQRTNNDEILNLVIECHFVDITLYEITLVTAMVEDNFRIFDGQYVLDIDGDSSILSRKIANKITKIRDFGYQ
ncbi:hypothetical protein AAGV33_06965 [Flavobacterium sp. FBOR7N2.3]|uniref:Uncharacterized protein n=1 Tax=Flavobacterium magnesitis TaxID=3138077 RepID=A0ABV4TJ76_9FLAO